MVMLFPSTIIDSVWLLIVMVRRPLKHLQTDAFPGTAPRQCETPSRRSTFTNVSHRIRMSNHSDWRCR